MIELHIMDNGMSFDSQYPHWSCFELILPMSTNEND